MAHGLFIGIGMATANINTHHHHAWRAETALQAVMFTESFLHGMQSAIGLGEAFNGDHLLALGLHSQHGAALHRFAIDMHRAATALCGVAADMRAGEALMIADEFNQQSARFDLSRNGLSVDRHVHLNGQDVLSSNFRGSGSFTSLGLLNGGPDAIRRQRHVDMADAKIFQRVADG